SVISSNSGRCPGSTQPSGERMWATLTASWPLFTRPTYSAICLGLLPAAWMMVGFSMSCGIGLLAGTDHSPRRRLEPEAAASKHREMVRRPLVALLLRYLGRLRFPTLMLLTGALFLLSLVLPDPIPPVDELLLGLVTL